MRVALAQIDPVVGDLDANAQRITRFIAEARSAGVALVVLPELCVCGYPPKDLLMREGFVAAVEMAARRIGESATTGITAIFGAALPVESAGHADGPGADAGRAATNSLLVYRDNRFVARYDKRLLPTYDVFDEDRYFAPGSRPVVVDVGTSGGEGIKVGLSICEDLWKGEDAGFASRYLNAPDPVAELIALGSELIVSPSASPFVLGKGEKHRRILARHAAKHRVFVASVNQVGGNDDLIFDGHSAVYDPGGALVSAAPGFREHVLVVDLPGAGAQAQ